MEKVQRPQLDLSLLTLAPCAQVFTALLRCPQQPDVKRPVLREALDVVLPILANAPTSSSGVLSPSSSGPPPSMSTPAAGGSQPMATDSQPPSQQPALQQPPLWVMVVRKLLAEEGLTQPAALQVWHAMLRHPQLFYPHRRVLVEQVVQAAARCGCWWSRLSRLLPGVWHGGDGCIVGSGLHGWCWLAWC